MFEHYSVLLDETIDALNIKKRMAFMWIVL